jgi:hypothetical protein
MGFNTIDCGCKGIENGLIIRIERRIILANMSVVCIQELYMLTRKSWGVSGIWKEYREVFFLPMTAESFCTINLFEMPKLVGTVSKNDHR